MGVLIMTYGIRILDKKNSIVIVDLPDILSEIQDGDQYYWSILYLYAVGNLGEGKSIPEFEDQVRNSENGFLLNWKELNLLAKRFFQIKDITLLGCIRKDLVKRYETDEKMYEICDIVIEMFDYSYWDVYCKDKNLIEKLTKKFKDVEWLTKNE
jgi:hypothetical protein